MQKRKSQWLGLEKFSKISIIKRRKISPFKNCETKLSWKFPTILKGIDSLHIFKQAYA